MCEGKRRGDDGFGDLACGGRGYIGGMREGRCIWGRSTNE